MHRRQFLASTSSACLTAVLPFPAATLAAPAAEVVAPSVTPMWAIGTAGNYDWQAIAAETAEDALRIYAEANGWVEEDGSISKSLDVARCKAWDGIETPTGGDWLRAGMGYLCARCGNETCSDMGHAVGDDAICEDCMTMADWEQVDPEYAAELREEAA